MIGYFTCVQQIHEREDVIENFFESRSTSLLLFILASSSRIRSVTTFSALKSSIFVTYLNLLMFTVNVNFLHSLILGDTIKVIKQELVQNSRQFEGPSSKVIEALPLIGDACRRISLALYVSAAKENMLPEFMCRGTGTAWTLSRSLVISFSPS